MSGLEKLLQPLIGGRGKYRVQIIHESQPRAPSLRNWGQYSGSSGNRRGSWASPICLLLTEEKRNETMP